LIADNAELEKADCVARSDWAGADEVVEAVGAVDHAVAEVERQAHVRQHLPQFGIVRRGEDKVLLRRVAEPRRGDCQRAG
jgi:hypothetical protein